MTCGKQKIVFVKHSVIVYYSSVLDPEALRCSRAAGSLEWSRILGILEPLLCFPY